MDFATRWVEVYVLPNQTAEATVKALEEHFVPRYGGGQTFVTDNGPNFTSQVFQLYCVDNGIKLSHTIPFHPASSPVERFHKDLNSTMRMLLQNSPDSHWPKKLKEVLRALRTTPSSVTKVSPYYQVFGVHPVLAIDDLVTGTTVNRQTKSMEELKQINAMDWDLLRTHVNKATGHRHLQNAQARVNEKGQSKTLVLFKPGDLVDYWRPYDRTDPSRAQKLIRTWSGPYGVVTHDPAKPHRVIIRDTKSGSNLVVYISHVWRHRRPDPDLIGTPEVRQDEPERVVFDHSDDEDDEMVQPRTLIRPRPTLVPTGVYVDVPRDQLDIDFMDMPDLEPDEETEPMEPEPVAETPRVRMPKRTLQSPPEESVNKAIRHESFDSTGSGISDNDFDDAIEY